MFEYAKYIYGGRFISRGTWTHPDRVIDNTELILVLKGSFSITEDGIPYSLSPGDVLRLDPGHRHFGTAPCDSAVSFYWVHFVGVAPNTLPPKHFRPENTAQAELLVRQILHYGSTPGYPADCTDSLLRVLLMELAHSGSQQGGQQLAAAVKEWVKYNDDRPVRVSDIAAHFGYNEDYLNRVFKRFYPKGLKAYLDECRMQRIQYDLLHEDLPLQELAVKHGFSEYKYFLKFFKYHAGLSPTAYRKSYYNIHLNNK